MTVDKHFVFKGSDTPWLNTVVLLVVPWGDGNDAYIPWSIFCN